MKATSEFLRTVRVVAAARGGDEGGGACAGAEGRGVVAAVGRRGHIGGIQHEELAVLGEGWRELDEAGGQAMGRVVLNHGSVRVVHGVPREERVEARLVGLRRRRVDDAFGPVERRPSDHKSARVRVDRHAHGRHNVEGKRPQIEHDLGVQARRGANVQDGIGGSTVGIRLTTLAMCPAHLTDEPQHSGEVVGLKREGLIARATMGRGIQRVRGRRVVVNVDRPTFRDAPGARPEARTTSAQESVAMDAPPGVLGPVQRLRPGRHWYDARAGIGVEEDRKARGFDKVPMPLAYSFGGEVAADHR
jgi:hypothetical protein